MKIRIRIKEKKSQYARQKLDRDRFIAAHRSGERDFRLVNLSGADLRNIDLTDADLTDADLSGSDLRRANLSGALLYSANLSGSDLRRANLYGARMYSANLSDVYLDGADLRGDSDSDSHLNHVTLDGARLNNTRLPCLAFSEGLSLLFAQSNDSSLQGKINKQTHEFLIDLFPLFQSTSIPKDLFSIILQFIGHERVTEKSLHTFYENARFLNAFWRFHPDGFYGHRPDFNSLLKSSTPRSDAKKTAERDPVSQVARTYEVLSGDEKLNYVISTDGKKLLRALYEKDNELFIVPDGIEVIASDCFLYSSAKWFRIPVSVQKLDVPGVFITHKLKGVHIEAENPDDFNRIKKLLPRELRFFSDTVYNMQIKWVHKNSHILFRRGGLGSTGLPDSLYSIIALYFYCPFEIADFFCTDLPEEIGSFHPTQDQLKNYEGLLNQGLELKELELKRSNSSGSVSPSNSSPSLAKAASTMPRSGSRESEHLSMEDLNASGNQFEKHEGLLNQASGYKIAIWTERSAAVMSVLIAGGLLIEAMSFKVKAWAEALSDTVLPRVGTIFCAAVLLLGCLSACWQMIYLRARAAHAQASKAQQAGIVGCKLLGIGSMATCFAAMAFPNAGLIDFCHDPVTAGIVFGALCLSGVVGYLGDYLAQEITPVRVPVKASG